MKKKISLILVLILIVLSFSACSSIGLGGENIMAPPGAGGERNEITKILEGISGNDMVFFYPKTGVNRSAILNVNNFTQETKTDDIVAFCSSKETGNANIVFLSKIGGTYKISALFEKNYSIVDRVYFSDLNGDGRNEVIVGWGSPINSTGNICIYSYNDKTKTIIEEDLVESYSEMSVADYLGNGNSEIMVLTLSKTVSEENEASRMVPAYATLYDFNGKNSTCLSSAALDSSAVNYALVSTGKTETSANVCIADCLRADNVMFSQIIYWDAVKSAVAVYPSSSEITAVNETARKFYVYSKDVNEDGLIEIPTSYALPFADDAALDKSYHYALVAWNRFDKENSKLLLLSREYTSYDNGYTVRIPIEWNGKVALSLKENSFTLFEWNPDENKVGKMIFKISTLPAGAAASDLGEILYSDSEKRYLLTIGNSDIVKTDIQTIKENFSVLG